MKGFSILHFGEQFVSKRLLKFLEESKGEHIRISKYGKTIDPANSVKSHFQYSPKIFIDELLPKLKKNSPSAFLKEIQQQNNIITNEISSFTHKHTKQVNEISIINLVTQNIKDHSSLFIASSMPIRDMDTFALATEKTIAIGANRGASGIDGTIASAAGFAAGHQKPTTLLIGDLAFIHDQSSLITISKDAVPLIIILINNQGGGIFSFLPISNYKDVFEDNFATPHKLSFKNLAEQYGLNYFTPKTNADFIKTYNNCQTNNKPALIEIKSDRRTNYKIHKNFEFHLKEKLP